MKTLCLLNENAHILNEIRIRLVNHENLSSEQSEVLYEFLNHLPPAEALLSKKFPLNEIFEIEETQPHLKEWIELFNKLPKCWSGYPYADCVDVDENIWARNASIEVIFIPSLEYGGKSKKDNKIISLYLKPDGIAGFHFWTSKDAETFPELYNFKGSWGDAYLLTVKTLKQGWPQTKFPQEFEQFL